MKYRHPYNEMHERISGARATGRYMIVILQLAHDVRAFLDSKPRAKKLLRINLRGSRIQNFLGGACPQTP